MNEKELAEITKELVLTADEIAELHIRAILSESRRLAKAQLHNAFTTPITIERECPECKGQGEIFHRGVTDTLKAWGIRSRCINCNGSGKVSKTFTIKEAIERMVG